MDNYVYIVAGLPELTLAFEHSDFSYERVRDYFYSLLSVKDQKIIDLLEENFNKETLNADFYRKAENHPNRFLRDYAHFDLMVRNLKVKHLGQRLNQSVEKYLIDTENTDFEEEQQVLTIFDNPDFVMREQQMTQLKWAKVTEMTRMDYFNLNVILAFLVKAEMIQRWAAMDKEQGQHLFALLVNEVRGTFKGVNYKETK